MLTAKTLESAAIYLISSVERGKDIDELVALFKEVGIPFPIFTKLQVIYDDGDLDNAYYQFLVDEGCKFLITDEKGNLLPNKSVKTSKLNEMLPQYLEPALAPNDLECIRNSKLGEKLLIWFTDWILKLNPEQQGRFLLALAKDKESIIYKVSEEGEFLVKILGFNSGASFNFASKEVYVRQEHVFREQVTVGEEFISTYGIMFLLAIKAMENLDGLPNEINLIPNALHRNLEYGIHALDNYNASEDPTMLMANFSVLSVKVNLEGNVYPWVNFTSEKVVESAIDTFLIKGEAIITDKNYMKDVGGSMAANAAGVGRNTIELNIEGKTHDIDVTLNNNRSDKKSKLLNGPNQFYRFLKAKVEGWKPMTWGNLLPNGEVIHQGGIPLKTAIVETAINPGSGPAFIRPGLKFNCSVRKSAGEGSVEFLALPKKVRQKLTELGIEEGFIKSHMKPGVAYLRKLIQEKCEAIMEQSKDGKIYRPGETILSFGSEFGIDDITICANREMNQDFRVVNYKISEDLTKPNSFGADYFKVKFTVDMVFRDDYVKMRNAYIKLTTLPYDVKWFDDSHVEIPNWGGVDIMLNPETTKSPSIFMAMFIMEMGGGYYSPNDGKVFLEDWSKAEEFFTEDELNRYLLSSEEMFIETTPDIEARYNKGELEIFKQTPRRNAIHNWTASKIEHRFIQLDVEKEYWDYVSQIIDPSRIEKVVDKGSYYQVTERVRVLISDYNYEVEISTPRENSGTTSLTLQQHVYINAVDKELGAALAKESEASRLCAANLIQMNTYSLEQLAKRVDYSLLILDEKGRAKLKYLLGDSLDENDRKLFEKLLSLLSCKLEDDSIDPKREKGIILAYEYTNAVGNLISIAIPIKISAILNSVGFVNGYADGIGRQLSTLIRYACSCDSDLEFSADMNLEGTLASLCSSVEKGMKTWFNTIRNSEGIYKKMSMTSEVGVNLKIRTSYHPALYSSDGLPIVILHPRCDAARKLAKNYGVKVKELDGMIVGLMRVPMPMLAAFRVKLDKKVGRVAHALVTPHLWAFLNEGDSDGDGVLMVMLQKYGYNLNRALALNSDELSLKGYWIAYGLKPQKHPFADFCQVPEKKQIDYLWQNNYTLTADYVETCKKVRRHYLGPVGISYGVASMLTFHLNQIVYSGNDNDIKYWKLATLFAWRMMYEGLGLAGWSEKAKAFFDILRTAGFSKDEFIYFDGDERYSYKPVDGYEKINAISELIDISGFNFEKEGFDKETNRKVMYSVMRRVIHGMVLYSSFNAISRGKDSVYYIEKNPELYNQAALYGSLRQGTQGRDPGSEIALYEFESKAKSLHSIVGANGLDKTLKCEWMQWVSLNIALNLSLLSEDNYKASQDFYM